LRWRDVKNHFISLPELHNVDTFNDIVCVEEDFVKGSVHSDKAKTIGVDSRDFARQIE